MAAIKPYSISIPQSSLDQLQQKLSFATFPDELDEAGWDYGAPLADIKRLTKYWREQYDWRKHEKRINELPQYMTKVEVDGFGEVDIHFVHQTSPVKNAVPLLFVHGWPGSFLEVSKMLPLLAKTKDGEPAFHIVAPSLPNFGFSQSIKKKGFMLPQYAETCHNLMLKLGYNQYATQAGDWGFWITRTITRLHHPSHPASHINMIPAPRPSPTRTPLLFLQHALTAYTPREKAGLARSAWFEKEGSHYGFLQASKPQTLGYALADSPVALLAWIYEKLHDWTDGYPWAEEEVLTWVSLYLFSSAGAAASLRIYYEALHEEGDGSREAATGWLPGTRLGLAWFPRDIYVVPRLWGRGLGDVVFERERESGGHFAAWERPEWVVEDLKEMFGKAGGAFGVVSGRSGFD